MKLITATSKPAADSKGCYKIMSASIFKFKVINYCIFMLAFLGLHLKSEVCVNADWPSNKQGKFNIKMCMYHILKHFWTDCNFIFK